MSTRLVEVVVDAADPRALAGFWRDLLGWTLTLPAPDEAAVQAPPEDGCRWDLLFGTDPGTKTVKNRVHLDLASGSADEQMATVDRALALGAKRTDIGQSNVPWVVMADPEDNEFCVLDSRPEYTDTGAVAAVVVDAGDPAALGEFWSAATGWPVVRGEREFTSLRDPDGRGPWLELVRNPDAHVVKNRVHLDLAPHPNDSVTTEVERLTELGARPVDIGQGDVPWQVLADPEGNEFCVLTPR